MINNNIFNNEHGFESNSIYNNLNNKYGNNKKIYSLLEVCNEKNKYTNQDLKNSKEDLIKITNKSQIIEVNDK